MCDRSRLSGGMMQGQDTINRTRCRYVLAGDESCRRDRGVFTVGHAIWYPSTPTLSSRIAGPDTIIVVPPISFG